MLQRSAGINASKASSVRTRQRSGDERRRASHRPVTSARHGQPPPSGPSHHYPDRRRRVEAHRGSRGRVDRCGSRCGDRAPDGSHGSARPRQRAWPFGHRAAPSHRLARLCSPRAPARHVRPSAGSGGRCAPSYWTDRDNGAPAAQQRVRRVLLPARRTPFARTAKTLFKRGEFACADAVIAVSPSSADFLAERYGIPRRRLDVVMNGIHGLQVTPADRQDGMTASVVSVGSVIYQKGHDVLGPSGRAIGGRLGSDGAGRRTAARVVSSRDATSDSLSVTFASWVDDVAATLSRSDIACFPSAVGVLSICRDRGHGRGAARGGNRRRRYPRPCRTRCDRIAGRSGRPTCVGGSARRSVARPRDPTHDGSGGTQSLAAGLTVERMCAATLGVYERALS